MKSIKEQACKPSRESAPWAIWHWNLLLTKDRILEQLTWFIRSGFAGVVVRPSRDMDPGYLSDEFFKLFHAVLEYAEQKKIGIRLGDDFSLSWSGCFKSALSRNPQMRLGHLRLIENRLVSDRQEISVKIDEDIGKSIAVIIKETNGIPDQASVSEIQLNNNQGIFRWSAPEGTWRIQIFAKEHITDPSGEYLPNVFNHDCSDWYIHEVLELFKDRFSGFIPGTFEGFIGELPSTLPTKKAIPWDDDLIVKFRSKSKKNIIKLLPSLFCDAFPGAQKNRQQIYSFFYESIYERFVLPLEEWARKSQLSQWVLCAERPDGKMPETLTDGYIPSIEGLSAIGFQNVDGVGENHALLRSMADVNTIQCKRTTITVLGRNRTGSGATLQTLKSDADRTLLAGASRMVIDGFLSNLDQRSYCKTPVSPGWYAPEGSFMKDLCDYIKHSNEFLKNVRWNRQVAILSPTSEIMAAYLPTSENVSASAFDRLKRTIAVLERNGFSYDIVTDSFLSTCSIHANGEFGVSNHIRKGSYQALIVPYAPSLSRNVLIFIEKLVHKEGCVLFVEEVPHGTIEDGVSQTMTARFDKILADRHKATGILSLDTPEEALGTITPNITILQNGKYSPEIATASGIKDGNDIYFLHNNSEQKDSVIVIEIQDRPNFAVVDCERMVIKEIVPDEKVNDNARFQFVLAPHATLFLTGSTTKITFEEFNQDTSPSGNFQSIPERTYRILLKDQWSFTTRSLNAFPLSIWNVRIGLSRESGGFSHFYESHFQVKSIPSICKLVVGISGLTHDRASLSLTEIPVEITINGTKVEKIAGIPEISDDQAGKGLTGPYDGNFSTDTSILSALSSTSLVYSIKELLVRGINRISLRTTGLISEAGTVCYPPVLFGDFFVIKGQNGGVIDKLIEIPVQNSWVKNGFPYLCGKGIYHQSFELPDGYKKLVLCFPNVSGTIEVAMNGKDLGRYTWQPMCVDITSACEKKRNELTISVVNNIDTLLKMSGRPSGIIGDVYMDVY